MRNHRETLRVEKARGETFRERTSFLLRESIRMKLKFAFDRKKKKKKQQIASFAVEI